MLRSLQALAATDDGKRRLRAACAFAGVAVVPWARFSDADLLALVGACQINISEPVAVGPPSPASERADVPPSPSAAPAPSLVGPSSPQGLRLTSPTAEKPASGDSDDGPFPGLCETWRRATSLAWLTSPDVVERATAACKAAGVTLADLATIEPRRVLEIERAVLGVVVYEPVAAPARRRAITSLSGVQPATV